MSNYASLYFSLFLCKKWKEPTDQSLTDTETPDTRRWLRGPWGSQSESDVREGVVKELHQRFSSAESISKPLSFWRQFERDLSMHRRSISMSVIGRSPSRSPSTEELREGRNAKSIAVSNPAVQNKEMFLYSVSWAGECVLGSALTVLMRSNRCKE